MKKALTLLTSCIGIVALASCAKNGSDVIPKDGKYNEFDFRGAGYNEKDYFALKDVLYNLKVGESQSLNIETFPNAYSSSSLTFSSKDESIVTVDESGKITGVSKGVTDVEIKSKDGAVSSYVRVVVSSKSNKSGCSSAISYNQAIYDAADYVAPKKAIRYQYSVESYNCEGVRDHAMESFEVMAYDGATGYFMYDGPSVYFKVPGGAPEVKDGTWIFYPLNAGIKTRLIHITPRGKTFYDINTANYNKDYDRITRDILNFFFVSGEKILSNFLSDYEGKEDFSDFDSNGTTLYNVDDQTLYMTYSSTGGTQTITADYEINYVDIPAGTVCETSLDMSYLFQSGRCTASNYAVQMAYERDGKDWTRDFIQRSTYDGDFEAFKPQNPKDNGYNEVSSIYDL